MFGSLSIFAVSMLAHEVCAVSILDFGATCSEATNTVAIQRAIDDRAAVGGGVAIVRNCRRRRSAGQDRNVVRRRSRCAYADCGSYTVCHVPQAH